VLQARCAAHIGLEGLVLRETERTWLLVTCHDSEPRLVTVPKAHAVFAFRWGDRLITIYGNHFIQRSADRSAKKCVTK
jgi:RNase P/RNase MRP subunit p29